MAGSSTPVSDVQTPSRLSDGSKECVLQSYDDIPRSVCRDAHPLPPPFPQRFGWLRGNRLAIPLRNLRRCAHRFPPTKLPAREFPVQTGLQNSLPRNLLPLRTKDANIISSALRDWAKL